MHTPSNPTLLALQNQNKGLPVLSVSDHRFAAYGRIIDSLDATHLIAVAEQVTPLPSEGTQYVTHDEQLASSIDLSELSLFFGGEAVQIGWCNGKNSTINGAEYHKSPELFIAASDCLQFLTPYHALKDFSSLSSDEAELFFFPKGTVALIDANVLHLAPCSVHESGFRTLIILPKGTNEVLAEADLSAKERSTDLEARLLLKRNKWVIAHPERIQLTSQGALAGMTGENCRVSPLP